MRGGNPCSRGTASTAAPPVGISPGANLAPAAIGNRGVDKLRHQPLEIERRLDGAVHLHVALRTGV